MEEDFAPFKDGRTNFFLRFGRGLLRLFPHSYFVMIDLWVDSEQVIRGLSCEVDVPSNAPSSPPKFVFLPLILFYCDSGEAPLCLAGSSIDRDNWIMSIFPSVFCASYGCDALS